MPTLIFGTGRSGSTHLQRQLTLKTNTWIWGEHAGFLVQILASLQPYENRNEMCRVVFEDVFTMSDDDLVECMMADSSKLSWLNRLHKYELRDNLKLLIEQMFATKIPSGWDQWGFKEIGYGNGDDTPKHLLHVFPDAQMVFTFREPEQNVISMLRTWTPQIVKERDLVSELRDFCDLRIKNWCRIVSYFLEFKKNDNPNIVLLETNRIDQRLDAIIDRFGMTRVDRNTTSVGKTNKGPSLIFESWANDVIEEELQKSRVHMAELYEKAIAYDALDFPEITG